MDALSERRPEGDTGTSTTSVGARASASEVDDWLGEVSDDDWGEPVGRRPVEPDVLRAWPEPEPLEERPGEQAPERRAAARPRGAPAVVRRRRIAAGLVAVLLLVVAVGIGMLVAGSGDEAVATSAADPVTTPAGQTGTGSSTATTTTAEQGASTAPATTTPAATTPSDATSTTPATPEASSFTLPESTKLRRGEDADPAVVAEVQRALSAAGYDPGPIDGTYGLQTQEAVAAFQQANDLAADGVVGPETAAALNEALAGG